MPRKCSVFNCISNYRNGEKITVYKFPDNAIERQKWIDAMPNELRPAEVTKWMGVCAHHWHPGAPMVQKSRYPSPAVPPNKWPDSMTQFRLRIKPFSCGIILNSDSEIPDEHQDVDKPCVSTSASLCDKDLFENSEKESGKGKPFKDRFVREISSHGVVGLDSNSTGGDNVILLSRSRIGPVHSFSIYFKIVETAGKNIVKSIHFEGYFGMKVTQHHDFKDGIIKRWSELSEVLRFFSVLKCEPEELSYECPHCHHLFASERILRDHMRHHGLQEHIRYRHSNERNFACPKCDHTFKREVDLRRHLAAAIHEPQGRAWKCSQADCEESFSSKQELSAHLSTVHEAPSRNYQCHVCQKTFTRGFYLSQHLIKFHNYRWPSGHNRFRYKMYSDGFRRLQIIRYESIEVSQQVLGHELPAAPCDTNQVGNTSVIMTVDKSPTHVSDTASKDNSSKSVEALHLSQHHEPATILMDSVHDPQNSLLQMNAELPSSDTIAINADKDNVYSSLTSMREEGRSEKRDILAKACQISSVSPQNGKLAISNSIGSDVAKEKHGPERFQADNPAAGAKAVKGRKRKYPTSKDNPLKDPRGKRYRRKATLSSDVTLASKTEDHEDRPFRKSASKKRKSTELVTRKGQKAALELLSTAVKRPLYSNTTDGDSSHSSTRYTMLSEGQEDSLSQAAHAIDMTLQDTSLSPTDSTLKMGCKKQRGPATFKLSDDMDASSLSRNPLAEFDHTLSSEGFTSTSSHTDLESPTLYTLKSPTQKRDGLATHYSLRSLPGQAVKPPACPSSTKLELEDEGEYPELDSSLNETAHSPTRYTLISPNLGEPSSPTRYALTSPNHEGSQSPTHYALESPFEEAAQSPTRYALNDPDEEERAQSPSLYTLATTKEEPSMDEYQSSFHTLTSPDDGNLQSPADSQALSSPKYMLNSSLDENSQSPTRYTLGSVNSIFDENAQSPSRYKLHHSLNEYVQSSPQHTLHTPSHETERPPELHSSFKAIKSEPCPRSAIGKLHAFNLQVHAHNPSASSEFETSPHFTVVKQENLPDSNIMASSPRFLSHLDTSLQTISEDGSLTYNGKENSSDFNVQTQAHASFEAQLLQPNPQNIVVKQENPSESNWKVSSPKNLAHQESTAFQTNGCGLSANDIAEDKVRAINLRTTAKTLVELHNNSHCAAVKQENPSEANIRNSSVKFLSHQDSSALLTLEGDSSPAHKFKENVSVQAQIPLEAQYICVKQENQPESNWKASSPKFLTHLDSAAFQTSDWELSPNSVEEDNLQASNQQVQVKTLSDFQSKPNYKAVVKQANVSEVDWKVSSPILLSILEASPLQPDQKCLLEATSPVGEFEKAPSPFSPSFDAKHGPRTSSPIPKSELNCVQHENIRAFTSLEHDELGQTIKVHNLWCPSGDELRHLQVPPTPGKNLTLDEITPSSHREASLLSEASLSASLETHTAKPSTSAHGTIISANTNDNGDCGPAEMSKCARQRVYSCHKERKKKAPCKSPVDKSRKSCGKTASVADSNDKAETYNLEMLGEVALLTQPHGSGE